jgi:hypothetical protein
MICVTNSGWPRIHFSMCPVTTSNADIDRCLHDYVGRLEEFLELVRTAQARLIVALVTREDMDEPMAEVEKPDQPPH